ncbi:Flp pilus assembly protein CpaB [Leptothrix sp. BB-4]
MTLLLAVLAGLVAMLMAARWLGSQSGKSNRIAVAAVDLAPGVVLTADMVKLVDWPQANVPRGAVTDAKALPGRVTKANVLAGEPLLDARLAPPGAKGGLSALLSPGKRAMTVKVNEVVGVSGFAVPGNYVDVLVNTKGGTGAPAARGTDATISKIVLERMLVLAVAQEVERDATKPKVVGAVTLEVTPEQAEALDLARNIGTLSLVLRSQNEAEIAGTLGATRADVLGQPAAGEAAAAPAPVAKAAPAARITRSGPAMPVTASAARNAANDCVDVIRGMSKTTECF